jgi:hypothetical protein
VKIIISQNAVKFVSPSSPREVRFMAARGMVPLSARDVVKILYILCHDKDEDIRGLAAETLKKYSPKIIENLLESDIEPQIIDYVVRHHQQSHLFIEKALSNKNISDETLAFLASVGNVRILESIALNHERLSRSRGILEVLLANPAVKGVLKQGLLEFADPTIRQRQADRPPQGPSVTTAPQSEETRSPVSGPAAPSTPLEKELDAALTAQDDERIDEHNLAARIQRMSVSEKIKYAQRGNKETRGILLKDASRLVIAAVIKSPKITEDEVLKVAQNKQANDEAVRLIAMNKEWLKNYSIRLALVYNPKTPTGIAMRLMQYITKKDLKDLAGSRNVPSAINANAKKLMAAKEKRG